MISSIIYLKCKSCQKPPSRIWDLGSWILFVSIFLRRVYAKRKFQTIFVSVKQYIHAIKEIMRFLFFMFWVTRLSLLIFEKRLVAFKYALWCDRPNIIFCVGQQRLTHDIFKVLRRVKVETTQILKIFHILHTL